MGSILSRRNIPKVNLQIIGMQKAGTSALAHFLAQHPDICLVEGKEAHVFDQPELHTASDQFAFVQRRYRRKLSHYAGEKVICDATPITMFNPLYLQACVAYNPEAKFIVMLRDPVDRAESHFKMMKDKGKEKRNMLWAFLSEPWRLSAETANAAWSRESPWRHFSYLQRGLVKRQLAHISTLIPRQQVLVIQQSTLLTEHQGILDKLFAFIGLTPVTIEQERIFANAPRPADLMTLAARMYARLYYWLRE